MCGLTHAGLTRKGIALESCSVVLKIRRVTSLDLSIINIRDRMLCMRIYTRPVFIRVHSSVARALLINSLSNGVFTLPGHCACAVVMYRVDKHCYHMRKCVISVPRWQTHNEHF